MRHPMTHLTGARFAGGRRTGELRLDLRELDQLVERAAEQQKVAEEQRNDCNDSHGAIYAQGVKAALGWIAGHHADDRLTALLDIDEDQR